MVNILTDLGEEWMINYDLDTVSVDVGLYDSSTDTISDTDDLSAITTEPDDGSYSRQTASLTSNDVSGDWGAENENKIKFDVTNTTGDVNSYFFVYNFQANDTGDGSATDHLVAAGDLSQNYTLSNVEILDISAGTVGATVN